MLNEPFHPPILTARYESFFGAANNVDTDRRSESGLGAAPRQNRVSIRCMDAFARGAMVHHELTLHSLLPRHVLKTCSSCRPCLQSGKTPIHMSIVRIPNHPIFSHSVAAGAKRKSLHNALEPTQPPAAIRTSPPATLSGRWPWQKTFGVIFSRHSKFAYTASCRFTRKALRLSVSSV
jgi:hypothetical protein